MFDLPTSVNEDFAQSLRAHLVERTTESWMFWYGLLKDYKMRNGDCRVPRFHMEGKFKLGTWVSTQRQRHNGRLLSNKERALLNEIGFIWSVQDDRLGWEGAFALLKQYKLHEGDCDVPSKHVENGYKLGRWVIIQRVQKDTMSTYRRKCLEDIGFAWSSIAEKSWDDGYSALNPHSPDDALC